MSLSSEIEHLYNLIDKKEKLISQYIKMNRKIKSALEDLQNSKDHSIKANSILGESYQSEVANRKNEQIKNCVNKIESEISLLNNILEKSQNEIKKLEAEIEQLKLDIEELRAEAIVNSENNI